MDLKLTPLWRRTSLCRIQSEVLVKTSDWRIEFLTTIFFCHSGGMLMVALATYTRRSRETAMTLHAVPVAFLIVTVTSATTFTVAAIVLSLPFFW